MASPISYAILDISPIPQGFTAADMLLNSLDMAKHAENADISAAGCESIAIGRVSKI